MCNSRLLVIFVLNILWEDQDGRTIRCLRYSDAPVDQMPHLGRRRGFLREDGHVREHAVEVELLLVAGAPDSCLSLSADRQNGRVVELGVVQAGEQVGGAGTAGRQTDAESRR